MGHKRYLAAEKTNLSKTMKKEVENHLVHLSRTFERLITTLFPEDEFDLITSADRESAILMLTTRKSWIKVSDLVEPGVNTEKMVLIHLLHLQSIGRVIVDDVDPQTGAILVHLGFDDAVIPDRSPKTS